MFYTESKDNNKFILQPPKEQERVTKPQLEEVIKNIIGYLKKQDCLNCLDVAKESAVKYLKEK